jgi:hypothetical protein
MAYASTNPPVLSWGSFGGQVMRGWTYKSSDPIATVAGSSYFSNGYALGMRKYDQVWVIDTASTLASLCFVTTHTTGAGATVSSTYATT